MNVRMHNKANQVCSKKCKHQGSILEMNERIDFSIT